MVSVSSYSHLNTFCLEIDRQNYVRPLGSYKILPNTNLKKGEQFSTYEQLFSLPLQNATALLSLNLECSARV